MAKSGFRGVYKQTKAESYYALISRDGRPLYLGTFPTPEAAARAYDDAAKLFHGADACLNFPKDILDEDPGKSIAEI